MITEKHFHYLNIKNNNLVVTLKNIANNYIFIILRKATITRCSNSLHLQILRMACLDAVVESSLTPSHGLETEYSIRFYCLEGTRHLNDFYPLVHSARAKNVYRRRYCSSRPHIVDIGVAPGLFKRMDISKGQSIYYNCDIIDVLLVDDDIIVGARERRKRIVQGCTLARYRRRSHKFRFLRDQIAGGICVCALPPHPSRRRPPRYQGLVHTGSYQQDCRPQ